jgi:hypothetical protein
MAHLPTLMESMSAKDDIELELEKLVFGDEETFRRELHHFDEESDGGRPLRSGIPALKLKQNRLEAQGDLTALEDSEVCQVLPQTQSLTAGSYSSLIPDQDRVYNQTRLLCCPKRLKKRRNHRTSLLG